MWDAPLSPVRAAVVEQLETAPAVDRQTSPSQTSVHAVSESLQRTITLSLVTGWTHDRAGAATGPQPNTATQSQRTRQQRNKNSASAEINDSEYLEDTIMPIHAQKVSRY